VLPGDHFWTGYRQWWGSIPSQLVVNYEMSMENYD